MINLVTKWAEKLDTERPLWNSPRHVPRVQRLSSVLSWKLTSLHDYIVRVAIVSINHVLSVIQAKQPLSIVIDHISDIILYIRNFTSYQFLLVTIFARYSPDHIKLLTLFPYQIILLLFLASSLRQLTNLLNNVVVTFDGCEHLILGNKVNQIRKKKKTVLYLSLRKNYM